MIGRVLLIPAAGLGSRLGTTTPKLLVPVAGLPMVDRVVRLYAHSVDRVVLVVHPSAETRVRDHVSGWSIPATCLVQERPTGMLDAIMLAQDEVRRVQAAVWISWCDQVAVHARTIRLLAETVEQHPDAPLVMPTVHRSRPYIHLARDAGGRIVRVLHRREGDDMPNVGESDMGVFALSARAYLDLLPGYARDVEIGATTGERNFLPFIPWVAARGEVITFPAFDEMEAVGVNTPEELALIERHLIALEGGSIPES
jgi:bifunctional UDP-N-acetylglucosamine pyrophosphorylase/glucosamine-1-phosphate N-acetyltransferase